MKFLDSSHIDKQKWDELVANSPVNNIFCYSWYLDATTEKWGAILTDDYSFGWPFPYKNRILYKKLFQHPFTRHLDYFGNANHVTEAISILKTLGTFQFHFNHSLNLKCKKRVYQQIDLTQPFEYKKNAQRILAKNNTFHYKITQNIELITQLYFENSFNKIKQQQKNKAFFRKLLKNAIKFQKGEVFELYTNENQLIAAAFFLKDKETVCYLIGDCNEENKKNGAMFSLMDFAIQHYKNQFKYFDFGGSNVESVATFYKKMGGKDVNYFEYYS